MKQERLLGITTFLLAHRNTTAAELADRFGVSIRTIYRDLDVLSGAGVPVYANRGAGGGISLMTDYTLPRLPLGEQEREAMFMALSELRATRHPHAASALEKLRALWETPEPDWVSVDFTGYDSPPGENLSFGLIRRAALERRVLAFDYHSSKGEHTHRNVEPVKLVFRGHSWYLFAYCLTRQDYRVFKALRMSGLELTGRYFTPRNDMSYEEFLSRGVGFSARPPAHLHLKFYPRARYRVMDMFCAEQVCENPDGTMEVNCCFLEDEWVYGTLMSFGNDVEVLSPPHIREILSRRLGEAAAYYSHDKRTN